MRYCDNCGGPTEDQPFCPACGQRLFTPPQGPLYRVVPVSARQDVASNGFRPAQEGIDGQPEGVYLWDSLDAAIDYVGDKATPHDIYEVATADVRPDPLWNGYGSWVSPEAIPASVLRRVGQPASESQPWTAEAD